MDNINELIGQLSTLFENAQDETLHLFDFKDISHQQMHYIQTIIKMDNPTISELAAELRLTKPTVTVVVDKLVSKGYVKKVKSDSDRRCVHLHVAENGLKVNAAHNMAHELIAKTIGSKLTLTELAILTELLRKIVSK